MTHRFSISLTAVVLLVLLRLAIGWHFFSEGMKHYLDPHWTSAVVLRAAKGPLAPLYQMYLPDFHRLDELLHRDKSQSEEHTVGQWIDEIQIDWDAYRQQFLDHYGLNEVQAKAAAQALRHHQSRLREWVAANRDALNAHVHEWRRLEAAQEAPTSGLPYQKKRGEAKQATLKSETVSWQAELKSLEDDYHTSLEALLDANQQEQPPPRHTATSIDVVDRVLSCVILGVGVLLLLGLFTRLACVAGAIFLLSVVMMQPFWISETAPTFNQYVEMFALLSLAAVPVGRWAGLDYFVHGLLTSRSSRAKGYGDVSAT